TPDTALQAKLYQQRQIELASMQKAHQQTIAGIEAGLERRRQQARTLATRMKVNEEIEAVYSQLLGTDGGSKVKALSARDTRLASANELDEVNAAIAQGAHRLDSSRSDLDAYNGKWRNTLIAELAAAQRNRGSVEEQLVKA